MAKKNLQGQGDLDQFLKRLDWIDEERQKSNRRLVELEQRLKGWERDLASRERRIKELEEKLAKANVQLSRVTRIDEQLTTFRNEMVKMIEQYDKRRIEGDKELDKLRGLESETTHAEIASIRKEIGAISDLNNEMKIREAEDSRLNGIIGSIQNKLLAIQNDIETWTQQLKFAEQSERKNAALAAELETTTLENRKKIENLSGRLDLTNNSLTKVQSAIQEVSDSFEELRLGTNKWSELVQTGEHQRDKRLNEWQQKLVDYENNMEKFSTEWIKFSDQYKDARSAVQTITEWQEQIERRQREASELARVEANQLQLKWENFNAENDKQRKNFEVDQEQRWSRTQRSQRQILEQIREVAEEIAEIQQDKETLWRVQSAQQDAMKKWPRILLEEVEKAKAMDPNSRRQPTRVPIRED
jgi:chromosome segregation ATPase